MNGMIQATQSNRLAPNAMQLLVDNIHTEIEGGVPVAKKQEVKESLELITEQM